MQHSWNFLVMNVVVVLSFIGTTQQGMHVRKEKTTLIAFYYILHTNRIVE